MNSEILSAIGLEGLDLFWIFLFFMVFIIVLLVLIIVQNVKMKKLKAAYERFMTGRNAKSLEQSMIKLFEDVNKLKLYANKHEKRIKVLYDKVRGCYQKSSIIKYDAFSEMGGELSFVIAMLDEEDNGCIINSVHSSNSCYIYTKEIKNGQSFIDLGKEEREALEKAVNS